MDIADRVIRGEFGNGEDRIKRLKAAGYDPKEVQKEVNERLMPTRATELKCNDAGKSIIKYYEGLHLKAYKDPVGIWTIGYGHTGKVDGVAIHEGMTITEEEANEYLIQILKNPKTTLTIIMKITFTTLMKMSFLP